VATSTLVWKLASPYDAYISHVSRLNDAIERIRYLSGVAQGYEAGLQSSVRVGAGDVSSADRAARFRSQLGAAAQSMSDDEFEAFIAMLGGGDVASVESNRARAADRMQSTTLGLEQHFGVAGQELATLEKRGYNPGRADVARQLRENGLPATDLSQYRHLLHELGMRVARAAS
jgi:hypothetical protein